MEKLAENDLTHFYLRHVVIIVTVVTMWLSFESFMVATMTWLPVMKYSYIGVTNDHGYVPFVAILSGHFLVYDL
jgi:hypothetical protein